MCRVFNYVWRVTGIDPTSNAMTKTAPIRKAEASGTPVHMHLPVPLADRWSRLWSWPFRHDTADQSSSEEAEARAILDRVERELATVEERVDRLMHRYGL